MTTLETSMLKHTPFYDFHVAAGGKMVEYAGWEMPLLYRGIIDEHVHTRNSGSIFDVSHMGRLKFSGKDAERFLNHVLTRNVSQQKAGQSRYSLVCNDSGGVLDDVIVSRDIKHWLVVCNAANRAKLIKHFHDIRHNGDFDFDMADETEATAMVAVQGPEAIERIGGLLPVDVKGMKRYTFVTESVLFTKFTVFRSGYTGEDGVEIILPGKAASMAMKMLAGKLDKPDATIRPAGLGARDTLRLEAGMPLYGHELSESIDPLSAGLEWAVDLNKEFIGVAKLREIAAQGLKRKLVGLELEGRRIARQGTTVLAGGKAVGEVASGTFGPTVQKSIATAFVDVDHAAEGTTLAVALSGAETPARVVKPMFYKRS